MNDTARHAPGPWMVGTGRDRGQILDAEGERVASVTNDPTALHNAMLIAAAPELLDALQGMLGAFGNCGTPLQQSAADRAKGAIKQAEGRP